MKLVCKFGQAGPVFGGKIFFSGLRALFLIALLAGLVSADNVAWGQAQNTGTLSGNVTDETGSAIPGATIALTSVERGAVRTTQSNERGEYLFSDVQVGAYKMKVTFNSFADYEVQGINIDADANARIDAKLKPATASTVTEVVEAGGTTIDTRSATVGVMLENKLVQDLPLDGGNVVSMAAILPGVTGMNAPTTFTGERSGPTYSVSGTRTTQNLFLMDGTLWNNLYYNTGLNFPARQGLQEVSVLLSNFKAQYGRNAGSVYNVITKSGTNQIHGQVWEYFQNEDLNAHDYIFKTNPRDNYNQFGATVGGPIKRDKMFYFITFQDLKAKLLYQGKAQTQSLTERGLQSDGVTPISCDPNGPFAGMSCMRFGDVGKNANTATTSTYRLKNPLYYDNANGVAPGATAAQGAIASSQLQQAWLQAGGSGISPCITDLEANGNATWTQQYIYETGTTSTYDPELPYDCFNPVIKNIIKTFVPIPTTVLSGSTIPWAYSTAPQPKDDYNGMVRVDWQVNPKHTLDLHFLRQQTYDKTGTGVDSQSNGVSTYEIMDNFGALTYGNIGDTWVVNNSMIAVTRLSYKRYLNVINPTNMNTLNNYGGNFHVAGSPSTMPQVNFNRFSLGSNAEAHSDRVNESIEVDENVSWSHTNHNFMFGFTGTRMQYLNRAYYPGVLQFSTTFTGSTIADGEAGLLNQVTDRNLSNLAGIGSGLAAFAQDDWRILPRLTLNLGVRYELNFPWQQPDRHSETFIPGFQSTAMPGAPSGLAFIGDKGVRKGLINTDYRGIAPRIGFAYDVFGNGKTGIRGGFGMFFDALNAQIVGIGQPYYFSFTYPTPPGGASVPMYTYQLPPDTYNAKNPMFITPVSIFYPDPAFRTPYMESVNLGIQQHVTANSTFEVNYVGKFGHHLPVPYDKNPAIWDCSGAYYKLNPSLYCNTNTAKSNYQQRVPYTNFNAGGQGIVDYAAIGNSNYHALQAMFNMRARRRLTMVATYTYSRSLDILTNSQTNSNAIPNVFNLRSEYGPSDQNVKHNATAGWTLNIPNLDKRDDLLHSSYVRAIANNWIFGGKYQARTGLPISMSMNTDVALTDEPNQRPYLIPGVNPYLPSNRHRQDKIHAYLNPMAFAYPLDGNYTNLSRNKFTGPAYMDTDFSIARTFPLQKLRDGARLEFRAEAYNVWNTPNLNNPNMEFSCSATNAATETTPQPCPLTSTGATNFATSFDTVISTYGSNASTSTNARKMQLSLTLTY